MRKFPGTRISWKNGAYRYQVRASEREIYGTTWHRIGTSETDVYHFLSQTTVKQSIHNIGQALDRYEREVVPLKAWKSQEGNRVSARRIHKALGHIRLDALKLPQVIEYRDAIGENFGRGAANSDIEVLSHLYSKCIEWGTIDNWKHPIRGNRIKFPKTPRDRYVSHEEILDAWHAADAMLKLYIPFKLKTALDQKTICSMPMEDITEDGIYYKRQKLNRYDTAKKPQLQIILWDEELRAIINALADFYDDPSTERSHLFLTRNKTPYIDRHGTAGPFRKRWARFKRKLNLDFTEHDLRAKSLSDEVSEEVAAKRASHNQSITQRVYRRKAEPVLPLSLKAIGLGEMIP